jgi:tRNA (cmo5U34)-methyltransferase
MKESAIFLSAPLLFESGLDRICDEVWLVAAPEDVRIDRAALRSGTTRDEARARAAHQMSEEDRRARADAVLENVGNKDALYRAVDKLLAERFGEHHMEKKDIVKWNFSDIAHTYNDESRRRVIPGFDDFYGVGVAELRYEGDAPRVLDVGAGTGLYSAILLDRYPEARLTLIDFSGEMLEIARDRFSGRGNTEYILGDYTEHPFAEKYDIVISALSIHHLDAAAKMKFYKRAFDLLTPNGEFLNADQVVGLSPVLHERNMNLWLDFVAGNGMTDEGIERLKRSMELDDPSTITEQISWLSEAGFSVADCIYQYRNFAVFYGAK